MLTKKPIKYVRKKVASLNSKLKKEKPNKIENYSELVNNFRKKIKEN
jgi:3-methyladenine DNA glycosylase AlkC